ncbi:hypothetical protein CVIRNUC_003846 [Coccomyxa viridis]|uniref:Uncharacterized protein n=1 Tax=Coccomyxa viridis TaxID=1274662 RepID=A0AAV1I1E6_9CHLO|nr:hypothetical protein CVIRNUC_003846 [Coccomyxa viridis]
MGNRVTLEAFLQYNPAGMPNLGQLIFAAADMKASLFSERLAQFSTLGTGRTVYMSSMDYVLEASAIFHQDDRAGQVWPRLLAVDYILRRPFVLVPGTDSIDCSGLVNVMTHHYDVHAYFAQPPTLGDIYKVLSGHYPATQRLSINGQGNLLAVHLQPEFLLGPLQQLAGQAPPQLTANATWYCLVPPANAPHLPLPPAPAAPQPPADAAA